MKMIFLFIILFIIFYNTIEGFSVDNMKYLSCPNKYNKMLNNYKLKENDISPLPVGFYSSLLNVGGARNQRRYLESPICEKEYNFTDDYFINNKITDCPKLPGNCDMGNNISGKKFHKDNKLPLDDPFFLHGIIEKKNKVLLYPPDIIENILEVHDLNEEEISNRSIHHQSNF